MKKSKKKSINKKQYTKISKDKKKSISKKQYTKISKDKKKFVNKKQYIYVKNIVSFDVERVNRTFKASKITRVPKKLEKQIKLCSNLVIIKK